MAHEFKTQWCPIGGPHDWESCVYAHTYRDWRRVPAVGYSSRPCPQWTRSVSVGSPELTYAQRCPRGMACPWAHGAKEQLYHPQFYKTSPCNEGSCRRGTLCAFMHGEEDMRKPAPSPEAREPRDSKQPLPEAMRILRQHQPFYWNPPRYHSDRALGDIQFQDQMLPPPEAYHQVTASGGDIDTGLAPAMVMDYAQFPSYYYQLVPVASPQVLQNSPGGFPQLPDSFEHCYGFSAGYDNMFWYNEGAIAAPPQMGLVGPAASTLGLEELGALGGSIEECLQSFGYHCDPPSPSKSELRRRSSNLKGLRTPSSLGSPPLSEAHTEVPSPRSDEACGDQAPEASGPSSSNDPGVLSPRSDEACGDIQDGNSAGPAVC